MNPSMTRIESAAATIRERLGLAELAVILGSGLGDQVKALEEGRSLSYAEIPGMPVSTVPGHAGRWWRGTIEGRPIYMLQGRFHYYEGHLPQDLAMPIRVMKMLGVKTLILTNAAGCVNLDWQPGDLMLITDFINHSGCNPLIGQNLDEMGPRFPDMSEAYSKRLRDICHEEARRVGVSLREGVYMMFSGPNYETPAEIRMARTLGADAAGMSTVPETLAARHCGIEVLGISCLTNMAAGILDQPLNHEEVQEVAARVSGAFSRLLDAVIRAV